VDYLHILLIVLFYSIVCFLMEVLDQRYTMPQPTEWDELFEAAQASLAGTDAPNEVTEQSAAALYDIANELEDERLEINRYFAIGLVMCGLGKILCDPESRAAITETSVQGLILQYEENRTDDKGLRPEHITALPIGLAVALPLREVSAQAPVAQILLQDTLQIITRGREQAAKSTDSEPVAADARKLAIEKIVKGNVVSDTVAVSTASGTINVLSSAYHAYIPAIGEANDGQEYNPYHHEEPLDLDTFETMDVRRLATAMARLRRDEFSGTTYLDGLLEIADDGTVRLPRRNLPKTLPPPGEIEIDDNLMPVIHQDRLGCPVLYVHKLLPLVLDFVPTVIARAAAQIEEYEAA
jgi:hypothetical protein